MRYIIIFLILITLSCEDQNPITSTSSDSQFVKTDNLWVNDTSESITDVNASLQKWSSLKNENGKTYKYYYSNHSWPDIRNNTHVLVKDNKVYEAVTIFLKGVSLNDSFCFEPFDTLHASLDSNTSELVHYKTVDEIYETAIDSILCQNPDSNKIVITFHNTGLLKHSYYWDHFMQDAVNKEVQIDSLFFGEIK